MTFHPRARGTVLVLLGVLGFWLFPVPSAAQIPDGFATVGPAAYLDLPPAVRVTPAGDDTTNDLTAPPQEVPFLPTMDQSVYDTIKAEAGTTTAPESRRLPDAPASPGDPLRLDKNFEGVNQTQAFGPGSGFFPPDTHGAISTTQFVEIVNTALVVYDRDTGAELKRVSLNGLFGARREKVLCSRR